MSMRCVYVRMLSRSGPNLNQSIEIRCQCGVFMYVCYRDRVQTLIRALKLYVNAVCICTRLSRSGPNFNQSIEIRCRCGLYMYVSYRDPVQTLILRDVTNQKQKQNLLITLYIPQGVTVCFFKFHGKHRAV